MPMLVIKKLTESGSAKFFIKRNDYAVLQESGLLTDREINRIKAFIKDHYKAMYITWRDKSDNGFYGD